MGCHLRLFYHMHGVANYVMQTSISFCYVMMNDNYSTLDQATNDVAERWMLANCDKLVTQKVPWLYFTISET